MGKGAVMHELTPWQHFVREAEETKIVTADQLSSIVSNLTEVITLVR